MPGGLVIFGGGLVYSLTMKDEQGAAIALILGAIWFWNLMQKPGDNALPAFGRAIFLICCIVAGFFTALLLITVVERGNPLPGVQFALIAAGFFAVGWVMRFVLART